MCAILARVESISCVTQSRVFLCLLAYVVQWVYISEFGMYYRFWLVL